MLVRETIKMNAFFHHYQPIFDIQKGELIGHEGLFRSDHHTQPEAVFMRARNEKKLYELDSRSIHKAFFTYLQAGYSLSTKKLFLNVFPSTISNPMFLSLIQQIIRENGDLNKQIILELTENEPFEFNELRKSIVALKKLDVQIAIDDFGKGSASLIAMVELFPDYIKLDKYFLEDVLHVRLKQEMIQQLLQFCLKFNIDLIVEGVEDLKTMKMLQRMGIQYAQGYFLGKPELLLKTTNEVN